MIVGRLNNTIMIISENVNERDTIFEKTSTLRLSGNHEAYLVIGINRLFACCKGGNFNVHIWAWFGYFIC